MRHSFLQKFLGEKVKIQRDSVSIEPRFSLFPLDGKKSQNVLAEYHADDVENPDDVPSEHDTQNASHDLAVHKSGYESAHPTGHGNYCKNYADNVSQSEIIAFTVCHFFNLLFGYIYIIQQKCCICKSVQKFLSLFFDAFCHARTKRRVLLPFSLPLQNESRSVSEAIAVLSFVRRFERPTPNL